MEKAGIGHWAALYSHTLDIIRLEPARRFGENKPIALRLNGQSEDFYAVFTRGAICFCRGAGALESCRKLIRADKSELIELIYEQNLYLARFDNEQNINEQDAEILNLLAPAFRHIWRTVCFRSLEPGYFPSNLSAGDVAELSELTMLLFSALSDYFSSPLSIDYAVSQLLRREQNGKNEISVLPKHETALPEPEAFSDELLRARAMHMPTVDARLELDLFFVPRPVNEPEFEKPFFPRVLLLADSSFDQPISYDLLSPADDVFEKLYRIISDFLNKYGKPLIVCMQDEAFFRLADGFLSYLDIPHRLIPFLPAVNSFKLTFPPTVPPENML